MHKLHLNRLAIVLLAISLFFGGASAAFAQGGGPTDNEVNAIAKNLYCPVCESVPLDVCPTLACEQWRQQIADKLTEGLTEDEIYDFFVEQYGDRVLASPPPRGLNWLIYVLPPIAILAGAWIYFRAVSGVKAEKVSRPAAKKASKDEYIDELEKELDARR